MGIKPLAYPIKKDQGLLSPFGDRRGDAQALANALKVESQSYGIY